VEIDGKVYTETGKVVNIMGQIRHNGKWFYGLCTGVFIFGVMTGNKAMAAENVERNERFTTSTQMQVKTGSTDVDGWMPQYLTDVENVYWNFANVQDRNTQRISTNLASNAYQNLEMFLDNGYQMDYNVLKGYCEDYKARAGREDAYYLILAECLQNPYLLHKPDAIVTESTYNGRDYSKVFDAQYYYDHNPDLQQAIGMNPPELLRHFVECGVNEGRMGNGTFSILQYVNEKDAGVRAQLYATYGLGAANALGKYSYSLANYYGDYLGHYDYEALFQDMAEETEEAY